MSLGHLKNYEQIQGIDISFHNVLFSVDIIEDSAQNNCLWKKTYKKKQILKGISGIFKAGQMTAIMGVSGAGKTTLLNILTCRIKPQYGGKLYANNHQYKEQTFGNFASYIMQNDVLMQNLTVRQTLQFAASLKLNLPQFQRKQRVKAIADEMKLQKCLDTIIGGVTLKGISGGQKKRTSIAYELISNHQVIFLDEPTSGQDSLTSYIICSKLRKLTRRQKKTVIMTIHQPNQETYDLFDELVLLAQGQIIYHDKACKIEEYFQQRFGLICPEYMNVPNFFMNQIHHENAKNVQRYPQYFDSYEKYQKAKVQTKISMKLTNKVNFEDINAGYLQTLKTLMYRSLITIIRNPPLFKAKIIKYIFTALFISGIFFGVGEKDYTNSDNWIQITGLFFFLNCYGLTITLFSITLTFPLEREVVWKQHDSKLYTIGQYFITKNIVQIPQFLLVPIVYVAIYYFMIGMADSASQFFIHCFIIILISFCGSSLGMLIGSVIIDPKTIFGVASIFVFPIMMFSGYLKNRDDLPVWIGWIEYLSPCKYGFQALLENQVQYKDSNIDYLNFDLAKWQSIMLLFCLGVGFRMLSLFFLYIMKKRRK